MKDEDAGRRSDGAERYHLDEPDELRLGARRREAIRSSRCEGLGRIGDRQGGEVVGRAVPVGTRLDSTG